MIHAIRTVAGVLLIIMGVIAGPIPILQGWMFVAAGIAVLGTDHALVKWGRKHVEPWLERGKELWNRFRNRRKPSSADNAAPPE
jgi:hypothetical protein